MENNPNVALHNVSNVDNSQFPEKKGASPLIGVLIIVVVAIVAVIGVYAYQYFSTKDVKVVDENIETKTAKVKDISIVKPNIVVTGEKLAKVQIYFVPTGTSIDPETMSKVETATKLSDVNGVQTWTFQYGQDLLITNIFARGFDDKGKQIGQVDLPIIGASDLAEALYGITSVPDNWKTYSDSKLGVSFQYPEALSTTYITLAKPRVIVSVSGSKNIDKTGCYLDKLAQNANPTKINLGGMDFCKSIGGDGGGGGMYSVNYYYTVLHSDSYYTLAFDTTLSSCGTLGGPTMSADDPNYSKYQTCVKDQSNRDTLAVQPIQTSATSLKFTTPVVDLKTYKGTKFGFEFQYPENWVLQDANPNLGVVIMYPNSKSDQAIKKTISTTDEITFSVVENKYIDKTQTQAVSINNQSWLLKTYNKPIDGGTENAIEYSIPFNSSSYVTVVTGISNKEILLKILATFKLPTPTITITSPNGGESWRAVNDVNTVKWTYGGLENVSASIEIVDSQGKKVCDVSEGPVNLKDGQLTISHNYLAASGCVGSNRKVKMVFHGNKTTIPNYDVMDESDNYFNIVKP